MLEAHATQRACSLTCVRTPTPTQHTQGEAVEELLELAQLRLEHGAVGLADEGQVAVFAAVTALLGALQQLDTTPGMQVLLRS